VLIGLCISAAGHTLSDVRDIVDDELSTSERNSIIISGMFANNINYTNNLRLQYQ